MPGLEGCFETAVGASRIERTRFANCIEVYEREVLCVVDGKETCVPIRDEIPVSCDVSPSRQKGQ